MLKILLSGFALLLMSACDSPRDHRVNPASGDQNSSLALQNFKSSNLSVKAQWLAGPFPTANKFSTLIVYIYDSNGALTSLPAGDEINFFATMPSMGHDLDQPGYFEEISPGIYLNKQISLGMSGDWAMELWQQDANFDIKDKVVWSEFLLP